MKSPRTGPRRLEETKRIGRVLRILRLIDAQPRQWTRARLADELEVSERAIDNDLQLIRHSPEAMARSTPGAVAPATRTTVRARDAKSRFTMFSCEAGANA
jgi:HTH domain